MARLARVQRACRVCSARACSCAGQRGERGRGGGEDEAVAKPDAYIKNQEECKNQEEWGMYAPREKSGRMGGNSTQLKSTHLRRARDGGGEELGGEVNKNSVNELN